MDLSRTASEINGDFYRKSQIFPTPVCLTFPLEFWNGGSAQKKLAMLLLVCGKSLTTRKFFSIQYQNVTYRRTDGFAITISRSACIGMRIVRGLGWPAGWVGLGWLVGSGMGRKFVFLVGWVETWVWNGRCAKNTLLTLGRDCQPRKLNQLNLFVGGCVQA